MSQPIELSTLTDLSSLKFQRPSTILPNTVRLPQESHTILVRISFLFGVESHSGNLTWPWKSHPAGAGFEDIMETPEVWHCVAGRGSLKRAQEGLPVKVQLSCSSRPQHFAYASTTRWPPRTAAEVQWSQLEPRTQAPCAE